MGKDDFIKLLRFLKTAKCITGNENNALKKEIVYNDYDDWLKLSPLIVLFTGMDWARDFIFSLPLNLKETTESASLKISDLIATDFAWSQSNNEGGKMGWRSIESISFKVAACNDTKLTWTFPFGTSSPEVSTSKSYQLTHDRAIDVSIEWPAYSQRSVQGGYRGILQVKDDSEDLKYHVVGELSMAYEDEPQYSMSFSNDSYEVEKYTACIDLPLLLFNLFDDFPFSKLLEKFRIPGLEGVLNDLLEGAPRASQLKNVGFILEKTLSKVFLKEISGTLPLTSSDDQPDSYEWPLKRTSFSTDSLRLVLKNVESLIFPELIIQLNGNLTIKDFNPAVPFRLSVSLSGEDLDLAFELVVFPDHDGKLSIQQILDITKVSSILDVSKTFPSVAKISNKFRISDAGFGWGVDGVHFLRLGVDVEDDDWSIVYDKFVIRDLSIDIYATFPIKSKTFSLWGSGTIRISDVDLEVFLDIERDRVEFQLAMVKSPLTLKSVFGHFLGESDRLFPDGFISMLEQTGIESVIVEGSHDSGGHWSLSRFALAISSKKFNISDKFSLSNPKLFVDVTYPFAKRKIDITIGATIDLSGILCDALISWQGKNSSLTLAFEPRGEPLLLKALLSLFIPDTSLLVPPSLSFLFGIGLANVNLTLSSSNGNFRLDKISATIVSSTSLELWAGLKLKSLALYFNYSNLPEEGQSVTFGASLSVANTANLAFTLVYNGPLVPSEVIDFQQPPDNDTVIVNTNDGESWVATVAYDGTISVVDIMSDISGVDIINELSSVGLSALYNVITIRMSDLMMILTRNSAETSFSFNANVKYLFFDGPVNLICSKSTSWLYSFMFGLSSDKFLSNFGIDSISLTNSTITVSNKPVTTPLLVNTTTDGINVTFTGTLIFKKKLWALKDVTGCESLTISGSVSDSSFTLAVSTNQISLFNNMKLTGSLFFSYSGVSKDAEAAIKGLLSNIYFPDISTEKFSTSASLFIKLPNPMLGLGFTVDKLENAFSIKNLQFKDILFRAAFQKFPVPSEMAIAGRMSFKVDKQYFYGSVAIYYNESDLLHCGTMGHFETFPSLNQALKGFDSAGSGRTAPKAVDGTFANLEFSVAVLKVCYKDISILQGLILKGSLKLPSIGFDASFDINISSSGVHIAGDIQHAIAVTIDNSRLFALTSTSDSNIGPSLDLTISTKSPPDCYFSGEIYLLGLSASAQFELSQTGLKFDETISTWLAGVQVHFIINKKCLDLSAFCTLNLSISSFQIGDVLVEEIKTVKFAASFATKVSWKKMTWILTVTGEVKLVKWDLGEAGPFKLGANLSDFTEISHYLATEIGNEFGGLFSSEIKKKLEEGTTEVVSDLKDIGLMAETIIALLVKEFDRGLEEVIGEVARIFDLLESDVLEIMEDIGMTVEEFARVLKDLYDHSALDTARIIKDLEYPIYDIARSLQVVFGLGVEDVARMLKDHLGYFDDSDEVARVLKYVFDIDDTTRIAQILKNIGYSIVQVTNTLYALFGLTGVDTAQILKDIGCSVIVIASILGDQFGFNAQDSAHILRDMEFPVDDIARALGAVFGLNDKGVAKILKVLGYAIDIIARVLKIVFTLGATDVAQILKDIGYIADDIAMILHDVFGLDADDVGQILKDIGFAIDVVERVVSILFNIPCVVC